MNNFPLSSSLSSPLAFDIEHGTAVKLKSSNLPVFNLNTLTLIDDLLNTGTFVRASVAFVEDYLGSLVQVPVNKHRVQGGAFDPVLNVWSDVDSSGTVIHPTRTVNGAKTYMDIEAYRPNQFYYPGDYVEDAGQWFVTALGGTSVGLSVLSDVGVTDWQSNGRYNKQFGMLLEPATTNMFPQSTAPISNVFVVVAGTTYSLSCYGVGSISVQQSTAVLNSNPTCFPNNPSTFTCAVSGTVNFIVGAGIIQAQLEIGLPTSFTPSSRSTEYNALQFPTFAAMTTTKLASLKSTGNNFMTVIPTLSFVDTISSGGTLANIAGFTGPVGSTTVAGFWLNYNIAAGLATAEYQTSNSLNKSSVSIDPWGKHDALQLNVRWGVGIDPSQPTISLSQISWRNATLGGAWVHGPFAPYNGVDGVPYKYLLSGHGVGIRNNVISNKPLTNRQLDSYYIKPAAYKISQSQLNTYALSWSDTVTYVNSRSLFFNKPI